MARKKCSRSDKAGHASRAVSRATMDLLLPVSTARTTGRRPKGEASRIRGTPCCGRPNTDIPTSKVDRRHQCSGERVLLFRGNSH